MTVALVLVFLAVVAIGVVALSRNRAAVGAGPRAARGAGALDAAEPPPAVRSSVRGLRLGDVVSHDGHDSIVERTYRFSEGGSTWEEHLLVDGPYKRWLSVEEDEGLECVVWERRPDPELEPGPKELTVDGVSYRFEERGTAKYTLEEAGGPGGSGTVEYADYAGPGEQRLAFERYDGSGWEINIGVVTSEHVFDVFPGSGPVLGV
ncbi:MAG: hypothetical protein JWP18_1426 [Solirubrobacterales bacterium]|jgi:hypothetical protein|nr:hypothetical protein [Solirubrobacterales bacterium]